MGVSPTPHLISPRNLCLYYFPSAGSYFPKGPYLFQLPEFCKRNRQFLLCLLISLLSETKCLHKFSCRTTPHTVLRDSCVCTLQYLAPPVHSRAVNAVKLIRTGAEKLHDLPNVTQIHHCQTKQQLTNIIRYFRLGKVLWRPLAQTPALNRTDL